MISQTTAPEAASPPHVLGYPHHLQLYSMLLFGRLYVQASAECLGDRPNVVSQHLGTMKAKGLLKRTRNGKEVFCEVAYDRIPCLLKCFAPARRPHR